MQPTDPIVINDAIKTQTFRKFSEKEKEEEEESLRQTQTCF